MTKRLVPLMLILFFSIVYFPAWGQGCQSATLTAQISPSDTAFACAGDRVRLSGSATGGTVFAWRWSTGETDQNIDVVAPGTYFLVVFDNLGCTDTTYLELVNWPVPVADLGPDRTICPGDSTIIDAGTFTAYSWSTGDTTSFIEVPGPATYAVVVENEFGCKDSDTLQVSVHNLPPIVLGNDTAICQGNSVILDAGTYYNTYAWSTGQTTSFIIADTTGTYSVVATDTNGCSTSSNVVSILLNIPDVPVITEFNNELTSTVSITYQWYLDGSIIPGANDQTFAPDADGTFNVETTDENGCSATSLPYDFILFQEITQDLISEGISPNGDGILDTWQIPYLEFYPENELKIFNRWGNTVYQASPYTNANAWDGSNDSGKELTDGVYFYILELGQDHGAIQGQIIINR